MKLYLDPGHGGTDPGASGNGISEKDIALDIALKIRAILEGKFENIEVRMSRTSDLTKSLGQRTNEANAWGADFYLSIHVNSGGGTGYEDYIYNGLSNTSRTAGYQDIIHEEVMKVNQLRDRGQKKANFHVLRETAMDALLTENGFIDNPQDASLMKQDSWRQNVAQGHANGIARAFNLTRKSTSPAPSQPADPAPRGTLFKVIAGSFKARENANERVAFLRSRGIESFVVTANISGGTWFRVQAGAFSTRANAEVRMTEIKQAGIQDAFIATKTENGSTPVNTSNDNILGPTVLTAEQMNQFVNSINPNAPDLGGFYQAIGEFYGIRGDVAFAQAMHETDYFRFTGAVRAEQNNFAGIGATGGDVRGASFSSPEEGIHAHLQHLYAYATTAPLPSGYPLVDPRFNLVSRGSAPTWTALNGKWAVPGTTYGQSILNLYERMVGFSS